MIIILEGREGTGKTTLANALSYRLGYPVIHLNDLEGSHNDFGDDLLLLGVLRQLDHADVILDRSIISGYIYAGYSDYSSIELPTIPSSIIFHLTADVVTRRRRDPVTETEEPVFFDEIACKLARNLCIHLDTARYSEAECIGYMLESIESANEEEDRRRYRRIAQVRAAVEGQRSPA